MVKVISVGVKRVTCKKCDSILEYNMNEVANHKHSRDYLGDSFTTIGIICPNCNGIVKT